MEPEELICVVGVVALVAVLMFRHPAIGAATVADTPYTPQDFNVGPAFMVANTPWLFSPPLQNVLPGTAASSGGSGPQVPPKLGV